MDFLKELSSLTPSIGALAVLTYVVKLFLTYMSDSRKDFQAQVKDLHDGHIQAREDTRKALDKLADSMDRLAEAVRTAVK